MKTTVERLCVTHYLAEHAVDLRSSTARKLGYHFRRWGRLTGDPPVAEIGPETFVRFRAASLAAGHSPRSIETVVTDVLTILRRAVALGLINRLPDPGRRLKLPPPRTDQPELDDLRRIEEHTSVAEWPVRLPAGFESRAAFWSTWIKVAFFSAMRLSDLMAFDWSQVLFDEGVVLVPQHKTSDPFRLPMHPALKRTLAQIAGGRTGRVFDVPQSANRYRRELRRMSRAAGVRAVTPQMIRRAAGTAAELGRSGGGDLLLGRPIPGSNRFYIHRERLLRPVIVSMKVPAGWLLPEETRDDDALVAIVRDLSDSDQQIVRAMAARMVATP